MNEMAYVGNSIEISKGNGVDNQGELRRVKSLITFLVVVAVLREYKGEVFI